MGPCHTVIKCGNEAEGRFAAEQRDVGRKEIIETWRGNGAMLAARLKIFVAEHAVKL